MSDCVNMQIKKRPVQRALPIGNEKTEFLRVSLSSDDKRLSDISFESLLLQTIYKDKLRFIVLSFQS